MKYLTLIFLVVLTACGTVAPPAVIAKARTIDSHGDPTSGIWGVRVNNGVKGVIVDPMLVVPIYTELWPAYHNVTTPPAPAPDQAFLVLLPDGSTWCSDIVLLNYQDMGHHFDQDLKLQTKP